MAKSLARVLIVEDDVDTADAAKTLLEEAGFSVDVALSGREALKLIKANQYRVVLIDFLLPDMSGWDLYLKIREKPMKFVFLTAVSASKERRQELKKYGVDDYITKPFSSTVLVERVKALVP